MAVMGVGAFTFCTGHRWYVKKKRTTALKQYQADFPCTENKEVFCFRSSVSSTRTLSGILEPINIWTNCQFIWSGKVYIWLSVWHFQKLFLWQPCINKVMHVENWETDQLQHDLYVDISYKFTQCKKESPEFRFPGVGISGLCTTTSANTLIAVVHLPINIFRQLPAFTCYFLCSTNDTLHK